MDSSLSSIDTGWCFGVNSYHDENFWILNLDENLYYGVNLCYGVGLNYMVRQCSALCSLIAVGTKDEVIQLFWSLILFLKRETLALSSLESPVHFPGRAWEVTQAPAWWIMEKRWVFLTFGQNSQFLKCLGRLNFSGIKNWLRNAQTDCTNKFAFNDGDEHHNNDNNINDNSNNNNNNNSIFLLSSPWSCRWVWS